MANNHSFLDFCSQFLSLFLSLFFCLSFLRGHEHECCQDPVESIDGHFFVLQPGSSVATSLSGGEAIEKKVVIMEIQQDQYRTVPIPLYTTRPFIIADVRLSDELDPLDTSPAQVEEFLTEKIHELIKKVKGQTKTETTERDQR